MSSRLVVFLAVVATLGTTVASRADKIYLADFSLNRTSPAFRMNLDGTTQDELLGSLTSFSFARDITLDSHHAVIYTAHQSAGLT